MDSVISKRIRKRYSYPWFPWGSVSVFPLDTKLWGYSSHWLIQKSVVVFIYNVYASPSGLQIILQLLILSNIMQILYTYFTVFIKFILIFSVMFLCCYKSTHKCVCVWCFRGHTHVIGQPWVTVLTFHLVWDKVLLLHVAAVASLCGRVFPCPSAVGI